MTLQTFTETRRNALAKWREYKAAEKISKNPMYRDMRKIYHQMKSGRLIVDIAQAMKMAGVHTNYHPKMAIAKASAKKIACLYHKDGDVEFMHGTGWNDRITAADVCLKQCLPIIPDTILANRWDRFKLEAPVPLIPPKHLPKTLTDDYYVLWEVDVWKMVPPTDPWLLRRITKTHFVVLEGWDLTELEKSVMATHL